STVAALTPTPTSAQLSLPDALPIYDEAGRQPIADRPVAGRARGGLKLVLAHPAGAIPEHKVELPFGGPVESRGARRRAPRLVPRSEEHTSELQSREKLVCRLLLEKK